MKNVTKKRSIVKKVTIWYTLLPKIRGLMLRREIHDEGFVLAWRSEGIHGIHMWFVFFPIDILFLDKEKKVVEL